MAKASGSETRKMLSLVESSGYRSDPKREKDVRRDIRNYEATIRAAFPTNEADMIVRMFDHYRNERVSKGHVDKSIYRDIGTVMDYLLFSDERRYNIAPPWEWEEERWSAWCAKVATAPIRNGRRKGLSRRSQRNTQTAVRLFYRRIVECRGIVQDVVMQFGVRLREFISIWNTQVHITDANDARERPHFTKEELRRFFATLKEMIAEAEEFGLTREALHLTRDLVLFRTQYWFGLRADELLRLNTTSFFSNRDKKEFGEFGGVTVFGKGSDGSDKKKRHIVTVFKRSPQLLKWYLEYVRPRYLSKKNDGTKALFLSERGGRLGYADFLKRFGAVLDRAMLPTKGLTPHSLRHTYTTHLEEAGFHNRFIQKQLGHVYLSTTEQYSHYGNAQIREMYLVAMAEDKLNKRGRKAASEPRDEKWQEEDSGE